MVKEYGLLQFDGSRIAIRMENMESELENGHLLIDIFPEEDLAVYSLPDDINTTYAKKAATSALAKLAEQKRITNHYSPKCSYFRAYLLAGSKVKITRKTLSKQRSKYRGDAKFSNAFKSSKVRSNEIELETIDI